MNNNPLVSKIITKDEDGNILFNIREDLNCKILGKLADTNYPDFVTVLTCQDKYGYNILMSMDADEYRLPVLNHLATTDYNDFIQILQLQNKRGYNILHFMDGTALETTLNHLKAPDLVDFATQKDKDGKSMFDITHMFKSFRVPLLHNLADNYYEGFIKILSLPRNEFDEGHTILSHIRGAELNAILQKVHPNDRPYVQARNSLNPEIQLSLLELIYQKER